MEIRNTRYKVLKVGGTKYEVQSFKGERYEIQDTKLNMKEMQDLKRRTQKFASDCWWFCSKIPRSREYDAWVRQLIRCSSSVGANYRASQRGKSTADFINKLKIVEEEVDEATYWLELFLEVMDTNHTEIKRLKKEGDELLAITVASIKIARKNSELK